MKYNDMIKTIRTFSEVGNNPTVIAHNFLKNDFLNPVKMPVFDNPVLGNSKVNRQPESMSANKTEAIQGTAQKDEAKDSKRSSASPQGVIDSIASELTSVRLQQAIILSEIVGKPKSKTRRKRFANIQ